MVFLQKVPALFTEDDKLTMAMRFLKRIEPDIPSYHTRAMRKLFDSQVKQINTVNIPPHVIRKIYQNLTGDISAELQSAEIDKRVNLAIECNDPDLICDLRHLNKGRPSDTFDIFFRELEIIVEQMTAADERRHECHSS